MAGDASSTQTIPKGPPEIADPGSLALVARMELVARTAVEGLLSGRHPSPYFGSSVEYADHRPYTPSDELRMLDWKLLAKTDKHYVKLYEEETNTRITVILDTSRSMDFGSEGHPTKLDYGRCLAAALCHLAIKQNDAAGLGTFDSGIRAWVPPRSAGRHFRHILAELARAAPGSDTAVGDSLRQLAGRLPKRGIVILISDLLDTPASVATGLSLLASLRHDLIVFHLVDPAERSFPWDKVTRFRDMEGEGRIVTNPRQVRAAYLERFDAFLATIRAACLERSVSYELATTDQPYAAMLSRYLGRRSRLTG